MKTHNFQKLFFLCLLVIPCRGNSTGIVIVKDHAANAEIVLPVSSSSQLQYAAKKLQDYIKKSTGALLNITTVDNENLISIEIGFTSFVKNHNVSIKNIDEDGFTLYAVDLHHFIILGGSDWGTEFGVYSFLEQYVGVHWLMPSDFGTDIPIHSTLIIPDEKKIDSPVYISRQISPFFIQESNIFGIWDRYNAFRGRIAFHHNLLNLFNPKEFLKTNPDFYPENGKKIKPDGYFWQPNFSAPGIADSAAAKIIRYFDKNPNVDSYSLGINDYPAFDQSPSSLARRNGLKNFLGMEDVSNDYFKWVNDVVRKVLLVYPNKYFGLLAYNNVAGPPSPEIGVSAHVIPFLTYERLRWVDPFLEKQGHQLTEDWAKECNSLGWYDYDYGLNYLLPRVWFHEMQKYLEWGAKHEVKYYYAELYPNWGEGPKPWILGKLLWNPNQDVDSLLNVWYVAAAGKKAAPKLKEYYQIWEQFWTKDIFTTKWNTNKGLFLPLLDISYLEYVPDDYIKRSDLLMNDAFNLAETGLQKQRVGELKDMWQLYKLALTIYKNPSIPESEKKQNLINSSKFISLLNNLQVNPIDSISINRIKLGLNIK